jgi:hypothetical protein
MNIPFTYQLDDHLHHVYLQAMDNDLDDDYDHSIIMSFTL